MITDDTDTRTLLSSREILSADPHHLTLMEVQQQQTAQLAAIREMLSGDLPTATTATGGPSRSPLAPLHEPEPDTSAASATALGQLA